MNVIDNCYKPKTRETWADNAKFMGIALMVLGHNSLANQQVTDFIYSFHMPLFFILSGYFASRKDVPFHVYLKKNLRGLLIPYLTFCIIALPFTYYCLWNNSAIYPCRNEIDFMLRPLLGIMLVKTTSFSYFIGPLWFFMALFIVRMMFYVCRKYLSNLKNCIAVSLASIFLYLFMQELYTGIWPFRLNSACLLFPFYVFGYMVHRNGILLEKMKRSSRGNVILSTILLLLLTYFMSSINGHVETARGGYGNYLLLMYINAVIGSLGIIFISTQIKKNKYILTIGGVLQSYWDYILTFKLSLCK